MTAPDRPSAIAAAAIDTGAIRRRIESATPGPWFVVGPPWNTGLPFVVAADPDPHVGMFIADLDSVSAEDPSPNAQADAEFIAAARTDIPLLLAEIGRLHALLGLRANP